jgi:predicted heme/steroid binding protein
MCSNNVTPSKSKLKAVVYISILIILAILPHYYIYNQKWNMFFATFFRDVSIYNSRRRLFNKNYQLVTFLFSNDEIRLRRLNDEDMSNMITLTLSELKEYNGVTNDVPIYISINNKIYDVTTNRKKYQPGGSYNCFVGKNATLNYATGCTDVIQDICPRYHDILVKNEDYTEYEKKAILRWEEFYYNHDKYKFIGYLVPDIVENILNLELKLISRRVD